MIEIREVGASAILDQARLLAAHWQEVALNKELMVLKPDVARYHACEAAGTFFALAAFDGAHMVGYSANFIVPHMHYSELVTSLNDVLYVDPEYRKTGVGIRLINETEFAAQARGARMVLFHAKPNTALEKLMPRIGYGVQDVVFSKGV